MPCIFSGIFLVDSLSTNCQLQCYFKDEDNFIHYLTLTHFQPQNTTNHLFSDAFQMFQSGLVYFITGTFAIHHADNILVTPIKLWLTVMNAVLNNC